MKIYKEGNPFWNFFRYNLWEVKFKYMIIFKKPLDNS